MAHSDTLPGSTERQLFFQALEKPAGKERAAFVDSACGNNPDLRRRLEALLQKFESLGTFLEEPAVSAPDSLHRLIAAGLGQGLHPVAGVSAPDSLHRLIAGGDSPTETVPTETLTEKAGDRIDRYKLLQ